MVEPDRPQMAVKYGAENIRFSCWITKATHIHSICNSYCSFTATMISRTCLIVTSHVNCLCCQSMETVNLFVTYFFFLLLPFHQIQMLSTVPCLQPPSVFSSSTVTHLYNTKGQEFIFRIINLLSSCFRYLDIRITRTTEYLSLIGTSGVCVRSVQLIYQ